MKRLLNTRSAARGPLQMGQIALLCTALFGSTLALSQTHDQQKKGGMQGIDHSQMGHGAMPPADSTTPHAGKTEGMDHSKMGHGMRGRGAKRPEQGEMEGMDHDSMQGMDHGRMDMGSMQGGSAPPDARDPDAYSGDLTLGHTPGMDMADNDPYGQLLVDQLEGFKGTGGGESGIRLDAQAWFGTDLNKLWLKAEGSRSNGTLGAARLEVLYNRAFAPYFGWQAGLRHDVGGGPSRNWAAFGVQGLAPYWFHVEAAAYVGESGRTALRLEAEYDLRITQRLVLQPDAEVALYGKSDPERGIGSGLSETELGLRLRYEITRKFAPYVGVSWGRKFGSTADLARRAGEDVNETRFVVGVRMWF